jgi:hypothetical protein
MPHVQFRIFYVNSYTLLPHIHCPEHNLRVYWSLLTHMSTNNGVVY